jgi:hypothetical protein
MLKGRSPTQEILPQVEAVESSDGNEENFISWIGTQIKLVKFQLKDS